MYSFTRLYRTYILEISAAGDENATHSSFLTLSEAGDEQRTSAQWHPNSLSVSAKIITLITSQTSIPVAQPVLDTSCDILPHHFLLTLPYHLAFSSVISLSDAKQQNLLTPEQLTFIDLNIGRLLGQLHSGVLNEWYGLPQEFNPPAPSYSWQESFTLLFESLLSEQSESEMPLQEIRKYLSRAIAYFLFDDVEVPSLVWMTGSDDDIYLHIKDSSPQSVAIAAILPNVAHAIWGDPLLETFFMPPAPSKALLEGYVDGGGEPLLVFPRQKTKRLWYTLFLALLVLSEHPNQNEEKRKWALDTSQKCVEALQRAQFY